MNFKCNNVKKISILGCGWLGKPLAVSLIEEGFSVKGSTTSEEKVKHLAALEIEPYLINISEREEYDDFLETDILIIAITCKDIDAFVSLIAQIEISRVEKVIFISSTSVYPQNNAVVTEENRTAETSLVQIEQLFRNTSYFETTILRFAGLFGYNRQPGNWFMNGRLIPQPNGFVNMIHQEDCVEIIHRIIHQNSWNQTFNACSNHHPTRKEFYTNAKLSLGFEPPVFEVNKELSYKIISSEKLQSVLNYQFIHDNLLDL